MKIKKDEKFQFFPLFSWGASCLVVLFCQGGRLTWLDINELVVTV